MEKFEYGFVEIVENRLSNPDPVYVEETEKTRWAMLLARKGYPGQASCTFLASKRRKYPQAFEAFKEGLG